MGVWAPRVGPTLSCIHTVIHPAIEYRSTTGPEPRASSPWPPRSESFGAGFEALDTQNAPSLSQIPRREALHGSTNYCMHQELEILYSLAPSQIPWPGDLLRRRESIVSHFRAVSRWWWWRLLCPPAAEGLYVEMGSPSVAVTE